MAKKKEVQESTKEVAAPNVIVQDNTTKHKVIKDGYGKVKGDVLKLGPDGVNFYRKQQIIK